MIGIKTVIKNEKAFTLVEILVAMVIFIVIIGVMASFSIRSTELGMRSRTTQGSLENARLALEVLNKKIRTSYYIDGGGSSIFFISNEDLDKYCYKFDSGKLLVRRYNYPLKADGTIDGDMSAYKNIVSCSTFPTPSGTGDDFKDLVGNGTSDSVRVEADGSFKVKKTVLELDDGARIDDFKKGFVQTNIKLTSINEKYGGSSNKKSGSNEIVIQSSVSVLDNEVYGLELEDLINKTP